jgi:Transcriptional regulatory protein, C terminal
MPPDHTDAQYLRVYVRQLRQKVEADPQRPQYILTESGIGHRLRAPDRNRFPMFAAVGGSSPIGRDALRLGEHSE